MLDKKSSFINQLNPPHMPTAFKGGVQLRVDKSYSGFGNNQTLTNSDAVRISMLPP
jgi:hypothetical protein